MRLELTGRHITITPALKKAVEQRLAHAGRLLHDGVVSAQVVVTALKARCNAEVTLHARGGHFMHGEAAGRDAQTAIAAAFEKLDRQAQKLKSKWTDGKRQGVSAAKAAAATPSPGKAGRAFGDAGADGAERQIRIVRARRYEVKPMSVDEAALEVGDDRSAFVVFRNSDTDTVNVLFRRPDGNLGLIEPEA
ncbi:MAG: ribosome-associated translation inhibitor RaiA [Vicinamibacterales bacterium]|nr:ribosome-associated translation inhibitor RaiA [Vicinamibacterales bacterium]